MNIKEHRARCVGNVGNMCGAMAKVPYQPCIYGAEGQLSLLRTFSCTRYVIEDPFHFGAGEVGVYHEACFLPDHFFVAGGFQAIAIISGTAVLPYDSVMNRFTGFTVPYDRCLPLVGDADGGNMPAFQSGFGNGFCGYAYLAAPDLSGIMFHPSRLRKELCEFFLRH